MFEVLMEKTRTFYEPALAEKFTIQLMGQQPIAI
jgi:hypothetical protein